MFQKAKWLGISAEQLKKEQIFEGDANGRFAYFRCEINLEEDAELTASVSANSRYRLWVNEAAVLSGPCKGDQFRQYYEEVELTPYLRKGKNIFAAQVLFCDPDQVSCQEDIRTPLLGVVSKCVGHRFAMEGSIYAKAVGKERKDGEEPRILADVTTGEADWRVYVDTSYYMKAKEVNVNSGGMCEDVNLGLLPYRWKTCDFQMDGRWFVPEEKDTVATNDFFRKVGFVPKLPITRRPIPLLYEQEEKLDCAYMGEAWKQWERCGEEEKTELVRVEAGKTMRFLFAREAVTNGYMQYRFAKGANATVTFTYGERFEKKNEDGSEIRKDDIENGVLVGLVDELTLPEVTDARGSFMFEPFWYRTFRFLQMEITADAEEVIVYPPKVRVTGYPLKPRTWIRSSSDEKVETLWKMCVRTLQNCMTETYMDCPFYEQMQFIMDTRLQALFQFTVSTDLRLAKKALLDFHCSMTPDGLMHGKYPSAFPQIISTFSLYFVYMLWDYYEQSGDVETVKRYRADVDQILAYYDRLQRPDGLIEKPEYWAFVDWQPAWNDVSYGEPEAVLHGPSTIINLMYAYALKTAAELCMVSGRTGLAEEYKDRQRAILESVDRLCWDETAGMYREGPDFYQFTQHAQAWRVLNGEIDEKKAGEILMRAVRPSDEMRENVLACSFSTAYELFRALEQTGLYEETEHLLGRWRELMDKGCTTCPETPEDARSENHAWSALPMFEMVRVMAGIRMEEPGWKKIRIHPHLDHLEALEGEAVTPQGLIGFFYQKEPESKMGITGSITLPAGVQAVFEFPDGRELLLLPGRNELRKK